MMNFSIIKSYPILYYQNYIYPNYYHPIENTKKFCKSLKDKFTEYYSFLFEIRDAWIEMKRMEEYRELCEEQNISLPPQSVIISGTVKQD